MAAGLMPPGARQGPRLLLVLAFGAGLWACAGPSDFSTAEMLPRGGWEAGVHATRFLIDLPTDTGDGFPYNHDWTRPVWAAGAFAGYGLTERLDLLGSYGVGRLEGAEPALPSHDERVALALKYGLKPSREAVSLGIGYHPPTRIYEINAAFYVDWHFARRWYYCFAPVGAYYGGRDLGYANMFPHVILDQSITWNAAGSFYLRPQIGIDIGAIIADLQVINLGLAAGF